MLIKMSRRAALERRRGRLIEFGRDRERERGEEEEGGGANKPRGRERCRWIRV